METDRTTGSTPGSIESPPQLPPPEPHHHHDHTSACVNCGGPTSFPPPPTWSETSPPPVYRPIRAPAINLPPNNNAQQTIILTPVPQAQKVSVVSPPYHFQTPTKIIHSEDDIRRFRDSATSKNYLGFVVALSESIRGHKISDPCHMSPTITSIISILQTLLQFVDEIPPLQQSARYGNLAYRDWHSRMTENADSLTLQFLPADLNSATVEITPYFTDSFGNASRIDYGTGHETNFAAWLYCLARLGIIKEEDYPAVVSRVFVKYLELMRTLQLVYSLEPAGSHGVWGLDDYHFLPFIFGSSQLIDHKYMKPKSIHNGDILDNFSKEYMYLSCIAFVKKVKKGPFAEHSPLLDDISGVPNWKKVNSGLLKMYKVEVMEKVPIMQHFLFGWLINWE
ncbi:uncharacterized protein LOC111886219 [Lactuca sativa]|uniref:Serine/threonine-protein phosphatase 2A activator n=1 Tax=Lactuca sativa TaxID=4236 RepID=A0A9R1VUL5_LACSA|nr:uncharacterized protein LOC111886219 [Lactuca sativa]KAJ0210848.1 hypothetical protein LSAT_V11C400182640 [Lactuca sativa]